MKNMPFGRLSARLAATSAALALVAGFTAAPAGAAPATPQPPAPVYIALGDSYAAGTGGGAYIAPLSGLPVECLQTAAAYPVLRDATLNLGCAGASTVDVAAVAERYATALKAATVVTITVGGNDVDAVQAAVACSVSPGSTACGTALYNSMVVKLPELPGKIKALLDTVKAKAPHARIVLTGYPRLFTESAALSAEQNRAVRMMNSSADLLNATIGYSALVNRVKYVSVTERFIGHGIGSTDPWIVAPCSPLNLPLPCSTSPYDPFHPNATGYSKGYAAALAAARIP